MLPVRTLDGYHLVNYNVSIWRLPPLLFELCRMFGFYTDEGFEGEVIPMEETKVTLVHLECFFMNITVKVTYSNKFIFT